MKDTGVQIIFENSEVVVVNKPPGLMVHTDGRTKERTLVDWIVEHYPGVEGVGETQRLSNGEIVARPGIVHRLDRETSGVMVVAKTQESFLSLKKQFKKRTAEKIYVAFVYGTLKDNSGVIDKSIGKSAKDFRQWSAQRGARGKKRVAITEYTVLKRGNDATYVEVQPKTGRTHQIRVHFKAIHHPVVCDTLYAPKHECILGFKRLALHAKTLSLKLLSGERIVAEAPLPEDFKHALSVLR